MAFQGTALHLEGDDAIAPLKALLDGLPFGGAAGVKASFKMGMKKEEKVAQGLYQEGDEVFVRSCGTYTTVVYEGQELAIESDDGAFGDGEAGTAAIQAFLDEACKHPKWSTEQKLEAVLLAPAEAGEAGKPLN